MFHRTACMFLILVVTSLHLAGCASRETTPTLADEMRGAAAEVQSEADRRAQLADDWERGQSLINSGQRKIDRGERRVEAAESELERGRREIEEGEEERREGRRLVAESEQQFEEIRWRQRQSQ